MTMRHSIPISAIVANLCVQQSYALLSWRLALQRIASNSRSHNTAIALNVDDETPDPLENKSGFHERAPDMLSLNQLKSMVKGVDDRPVITALAKAIKRSKARMLEASTGGLFSDQAEAASICGDLAAVSPLPSPAFASNLLEGRLILRGELGSNRSILAEAASANEGILFVEMPLQFGKPSKSGYGLKRGGTLLVRSATDGPALAELTCEGPSSFVVDCASGSEAWGITYLDQVTFRIDFIICMLFMKASFFSALTRLWISFWFGAGHANTSVDAKRQRRGAFGLDTTGA